MACTLLGGVDSGVRGAEYCLIASEVVPFTVWTSPTLDDGSWTACPNPSGELIQNPDGVSAGTDGHLDSNVSIVPRPDGDFEIVQRHGLIALSTTGICGPYRLQQPTNTYSQDQQPPFARIYPNRQTHSDPLAGTPGGPPATGIQSTYASAEDPTIWYSGGQYHVLYDYPGDRVGYHLTSPDGIHGWTDRGLAYDPRMADKIFSYTDGAVVGWFKIERPNVALENGHVTHVTWAVSDVDKDCQIPAGSDHGSKVIVVPFDGCNFDHEIGDSGPCDAGADGEGGEPADGGTDATVTDAAPMEGDGPTGGSSSGESPGGGSSSGETSGSSGSSGGSTGGGDAGYSSKGGGSGCGCVVGAGEHGASPVGGLIVASFGAWLRTRARRRRRKHRIPRPLELHPAV